MALFYNLFTRSVLTWWSMAYVYFVKPLHFIFIRLLKTKLSTVPFSIHFTLVYIIYLHFRLNSKKKKNNLSWKIKWQKKKKANYNQKKFLVLLPGPDRTKYLLLLSLLCETPSPAMMPAAFFFFLRENIRYIILVLQLFKTNNLPCLISFFFLIQGITVRIIYTVIQYCNFSFPRRAQPKTKAFQAPSHR